MYKKISNKIEPNSSLSRGKSFRFCGEWFDDQEYKNNNYVQDFVEHDGKLWGCLETNKGQEPKKCNRFWKMAVKGVKGEKGKEILSIYQFDTKEDSDFCYITLMVVYSDTSTEPFEIKLKKFKGDKGDKGDTPTVEIGEDGYWYINGTKTNVPASFQGIVENEIKENSENPVASSALYDFKENINSKLEDYYSKTEITNLFETTLNWK